MGQKRQLLVVLDSVFTTFTALKRGFAYAPFFASHARWSARYADRKPLPDPESRLGRVKGLVDRGVRRIARGMGVARLDSATDDEILELARRSDLVYLLKTPSAELQKRLVALDGPRIIVDLNDAIWLPYQREYFGGFEATLTTAHGVICENAYVAEFARKRNPRIRIVPDCTQLGTFDALRPEILRARPKVRLGWIGSAGTAGSLYSIWEPLEELFARHPQLELRILGAGAAHLPHFEKVRWSSLVKYDREQMVREALAMDIGLYPQFRVEDALARGNGKAAIYMAAEAVAVCENIGEVPRLITDNVNGLLATGHREWLAKLEWLVTHAEERRRIGRAGLDTIRKDLPDQACFDSLISALDYFIAPG